MLRIHSHIECISKLILEIYFTRVEKKTKKLKKLDSSLTFDLCNVAGLLTSDCFLTAEVKDGF